MDTGKSLEAKDRKRASKSKFFDMFSSGDKQDECAKLLKQASGKYITEKDNVSAIRCLKDCNRVYEEMEN